MNLRSDAPANGNAETGGGNGQTKFWGFSTLAYVMPLEYELRYDPTDLDKPITPILPTHLGLSFQANNTTQPAR